MSYKASTTQIIDNQMNDYGFLFCQYCKRADKTLSPPHHIIFKSERPKHPELHNIRNLILLCYECHDKFHGKIKGFTKHEMRRKLIEIRELTELFNKENGSKLY